MSPASRQTAPVLEKMYQFVLWLIPTIEQFPRSQKFLLGDRMQTGALDVLEGLVDAAYTANRNTILQRVNLGLEKLRFLIRLANELHYLDLRRYEFAARALEEIGRMVGGWLKAGNAAPIR